MHSGATSRSILTAWPCIGSRILVDQVPGIDMTDSEENLLVLD